MKIKRVYIENFGLLNKFQKDFNDNLNEIVEDNGWGKTTLAVFIKAMFYGLAKTKTSKINENERKKYMPWQGGDFGGYIEFEIDGKEYRIERFFGKKEAEDTFKLIDLQTGKLSNRYSENIGEEIFQINSEGYEKSTFFPQKELSGGINESISSKLINMIQGTENKDSFNNALSIIDERRAELQKRGGYGKINDIEMQIDQINDKINNLKKSNEDIRQFEEKISQKNHEIEALEEEKKLLDEKVTKYGEIQKAVANKKYIEELKGRKQEIEKKLDDNRHILNGNEPTNDELEHISQKVKQLFEKETKLKAMNENYLTDQKDDIMAFFNNNPPEEEEIDKYIQKAEKLKLLKSVDHPQKKKYFLIPLVLAVIILICGGVIFTKQSLVAIILFALGGISLLVGMFLYFKNYIDDKTRPGNFNQKEADNLTEQVEKFLSKFNYQGQEFSKFLIDAKGKLNQLNSLQNTMIEGQKSRALLAQEIKGLRQSLEEYFSNFNIEIDCEMSEKISILMQALKNMNDCLAERDEILRKLELNEDDSSLEEEMFDIEAIQAAQRQNQLNIDKLKNDKSSYVSKCDELKDALCELGDLEAGKERLTQTRNELKEELKIIGFAKKYLTEASDNLAAKYLKPMQDGLNKYFKLVVGDSYQNLNIDTLLNVSLQTGGKLREIDYLSKGYQEVIDLCIRFALLDTLFSGQKPFIIFDDPFVNMDKTKLENATKLLKAISKEYQLVYFICHDSRSCK